MYASDLYMMIYNELFIYVNVIVHLKSDCKLYVDRTYLFFIFCEIHTSVNDLRVNIQPGFKGEKNFYPDPHKQFQEIVFSRKKINSSHTKERTKNPQSYILIKLLFSCSPQTSWIGAWHKIKLQTYISGIFTYCLNNH